MTPEQFIRAELAAFAFAEAGHCGGTDNMLAVIHVVRNRQRAGWCGGDWLEILRTAGTVSAQAERSPAPTPNLRDIAFRIVLARVDDIHGSMSDDRMTCGALYYAECNKIESKWFLENIMAHPAEHARVAQVGPMSFFT